MNEFADVVVVKFKIGERKQMFDVLEAPGNKVVHANDVVTVFDKALAQM
jgi:hypothetical protein